MHPAVFTKGSGCYQCTCCKRLTRDDGHGDSVHCRLCTECYELAGLENTISDEGSTPELEAEVRELKERIKSKGGKTTRIDALYKELVMAT